MGGGEQWRSNSSFAWEMQPPHHARHITATWKKRNRWQKTPVNGSQYAETATK